MSKGCFIILFVEQQTIYNASKGNRTPGLTLEGSNVTTTPVTLYILALKIFFILFFIKKLFCNNYFCKIICANYKDEKNEKNDKNEKNEKQE